MANNISVIVKEHKGSYEVSGDIVASGEYLLVDNFAVFSFNGTVDGLGRFCGNTKNNDMIYSLEPAADEFAVPLMSAAMSIKAMIEEKFEPVQEP